MKGHLLQLADRLRESYWFIPAMMAFAAVLLAGVMIWLDTYEGSDWMDRFAWLYASRPSGARQVLSAIGGSMITVAGTVFSVTIAAVVYASGQYGPRLLSNFMRDRGNQVTLGTFIATFLYCLIVLRTIRSPEEPGGGGVGFVPNMALLVAVLLAVCSIAVLIFFIHHVPRRIHISSVIEEIGRRLISEVGSRFPAFIGSGHEPSPDPNDPAVPAAFRPDASPAAAAERVAVPAGETGYIQLVNEQELLRIACRDDLVLRLQYQPGDFVHAGRVLVEVWPKERCKEEVAAAIRDTFSTGSRRTALQDIRFLIDEVVEIAARALSPGVNDPFTATSCIDWLGAAMSDMSTRELPSHLRTDESEALRVIAHPLTFGYFLDRSFGALAGYVASDRIAGLRYLEALGEVALDCDVEERRVAIATQVGRFEALARAALKDFDRQHVCERAEDLREALRQPDYARHLRDSTAWLGGTA